MKYLKVLNDILHALIVVFVVVILIAAAIWHTKVCMERTGFPFCKIVAVGEQ